LARFALQDYLKESGYNLTEHVRNELRKTVLRIKKTHFIKNQGQGKAPMMYADLRLLLTVLLMIFIEKKFKLHYIY
jgi:hypothetical protein